MQPITLMTLGIIISASSLTLALNSYPFWSAMAVLIMGTFAMITSLIVLAKS